MKTRVRPRQLDRRGISIVELMVGVVLLAVVVVSLAAASLYASRNLTRARLQLEAAEFLQTELERLLAIPYDGLADGTRSTSEGTSSWTIEERGTHRQILLITNFAPTEAISVWDTVVAYRLEP
jgi:Tfp pilus assembly protein PilV